MTLVLGEILIKYKIILFFKSEYIVQNINLKGRHHFNQKS